MSVLSRLKRLWELSATTGRFMREEEFFSYTVATDEPIQKDLIEPGEAVLVPVGKPKGVATVVQDDPLNIFDQNGTDAAHEGDIDF